MTSAPNTANASLSGKREAILEEIAANWRPRTTLAGIGVWARWHVRRLATWPWGRHWTARNARSNRPRGAASRPDRGSRLYFLSAFACNAQPFRR